MKTTIFLKALLVSVFTFFIFNMGAQIASNVYISTENDIKHQLMIDDNYLIYTVYGEKPADFIKTLGGFYTLKNGHIELPLDFNSNFEKDSVRHLSLPFSNNSKLEVSIDGKMMKFLSNKLKTQDLDGNWLFTGRVNEQGEESRRDTNIPRKTMKFLLNEHFQWVAYNSETMQFFGSGGGTYSAENNVYIENILFFSRDNSRVGNSLQFNYELKNGEWYHSGKSSKGDPLHEIWVERN